MALSPRPPARERMAGMQPASALPRQQSSLVVGLHRAMTDLEREQPDAAGTPDPAETAGPREPAVGEEELHEAEVVDLRELFHRLTNVIPDDQQVVTVEPAT